MLLFGVSGEAGFILIYGIPLINQGQNRTSKEKMIGATKKPQDTDISLPQPLPDGISSIALNGDASSLSNILIATSWDNTVSKPTRPI
ncbi:hypothetical protein EON65_24045 [archaeon]|nr:MAG: hypothetical protein EON65_24045 [archaeon]